VFDRVHYCKLFKTLLSRHIPSCILHIKINFYANNFVQVSRLGYNRDYFVAYNSVKHSSISSSDLVLYIDELLVQVSPAGVSCYTGNILTGALAYANDIVLMAQTSTAMFKMLSICDRFAAK
jgi:hypothetical protein